MKSYLSFPRAHCELTLSEVTVASTLPEGPLRVEHSLSQGAAGLHWTLMFVRQALY